MTIHGREGLTEVVNTVLTFSLCLGTVMYFCQILYSLNSAHLYQTDKNPQKPVIDFSVLTHVYICFGARFVVLKTRRKIAHAGRILTYEVVRI